MSTAALDVPVDPGPAGATRGPSGVGTCFGTFGELLQGQLAGPGNDFLVTLPIARWTSARFVADPTTDVVTVRPAHKRKSARLASMIIEGAGLRCGGRLEIEGRLPEGKGMASSSADLVATARAVSGALRVTLWPERLEGLLEHIEPTDGVLYDEIVAFRHRVVRLLDRLGRLPPMVVVGIDEGGEVDTVEFNRRPKPFGGAEHREYARLLERLRAAVAHADLAEVGAVATRSATLNQVINPKRTLPAMLGVNEEFGGLGVAVGHSGTSVGVLLDPRTPRFPDVLARATQRCYALAGNVTVHRTLAFDRHAALCAG